MTSIIQVSSTVTRYFVATTLTLAVFMMTLMSVPSAHAESPDILVGNNLSLGANNQSVVVLQGLLSETGYLNVPINVPLGYFGSLTQNALSRYQSDRSVVPAVGYFGPITKVSMYNDFASHGWLPLLGW